MSSATSTSRPDGFTVGHLFVLLSLIGATIAVVIARPATPESLILVSLTIGAVGFAAVCFYRVLAPLVAPHSDFEQEPLGERLRTDLEREKALTLRSIKELEFDRAMGKLSQQDYEQMVHRLRARALGIMKQLNAGTSNYRERVERDLAARLSARPKSDSRGLAVAESAPGRCACGTTNDHDARFCKSCGSKLVNA